MIKYFRYLIIFLVIQSILFYNHLSYVQAGALINPSVTIGSNNPITSNTHTLDFKIQTSSTIKQINIQYGQTAYNENKPSNLNLTSASLGLITGLNASWTLDSNSISTGLLKLSNPDGESKNNNDAISINLNSVTNPEIGDCSTSEMLYDVCYIFIRTYSDAGSTLVDNATVNYRLEDEPSITFTIRGVNSGTSTNGITTNRTTDWDEIDFNHVDINSALYAAHKLTVQTTAPGGYTVNMKLDGYLQGLVVANKIDPFSPVNGSWTNPLAWQTPTGSQPNSDTAWIGANTSDTRVEGWADAANKFGPVSSVSHPVMFSDQKDYGTDVFVTYALEANQYQPPDSYAGTLSYDVFATY